MDFNHGDRSEVLDWVAINSDVEERDNLLAWKMSNANPSQANISEWPLLPKVISRLEPLCLRKMTSFGDIAAEDDAVLNYFLKTPAVKEILDGKVLLVLGRKGSGKTALVRHFTEGQSGLNSRGLTLGQYPWKVHEQRADSSVNEVDAYVESWRYLIATQIAALLLAQPNIDLETEEAKSIAEFFTVNYGGLSPELGDILRPGKLMLSKASFEPQVMGSKLGSVTLERTNGDAGRELKALTDALLSAVESLGAQVGVEKIYLHFDELDRGLVVLDDARKNLLIGLIVAAREVSRTTALNFVKCVPIVYLRTDLWEGLNFSDKNKISQGKTLNLEWDSSSLSDLINERIKAIIGSSSNWDTISSPSLMRGSQKKWAHILARTFLRPRDVISFLNIALKLAVKRDLDKDVPLILENRDIVGAREKYSSYLKQELKDEIIPHWQYWEDALKAFSELATQTFKIDQFRVEYEKRKSTGNLLSPDEAISKLYEFSVVGYERRSGYGGSSWVFQYTTPEAGWDNAATNLKVHVGLKEVAKLREERTPGANLEGGAEN
ncbi:P-loop ATPase, Sll1717 family [Janthinobacterium tructae]|uniref:Uncharacterized protein n=1 Tax=Janthinobacterium tructae TaxID=2590869 RepID=A0A4Y6RKL2_9BURK|nr:hypothetical protein [Janthinobacterium tructae]QDG73511.1 hypothetical protein FJQ89_26105 [Janthinobacterium tructae]